jgi:tetratricopeptide (TPR) repeat protein
MKSLSISSLLFTIALFGVSCGGEVGRVEGPVQYSDAATAFAEGEKLFDANKFEMAVNAYRQAVAMNNLNGDAYFKLGISLSLIESKAREMRKEVVAADEGDKSILPVSESQKAFEGAVAAYKRLLEQSPANALVVFNLGRAYEKLDRDSEAEKWFRESLKLDSANNDVRVELGDVLMKLAKYSEAISVYSKAKEVDPENFDLDDKIEEARAGRMRQTFTGPSPSPSPTPGTIQ